MLYTFTSASILSDPDHENALVQFYMQLLSLNLASSPYPPPQHPSPSTTTIKYKSPASSSMPSASASASTSPSSLGFPHIPAGNLSARGLDTTNTNYAISFERTPISELPFPHDKWHTDPGTGELYEVISPIFEEYDPKSGYVDSVGPVRESIESDYDVEKRSMGMKKAVDIGPDEGVVRSWVGYVQWPESSERSSIVREAKRRREKEEEKVIERKKNKRARIQGELDHS
ncbi:hypothetical protein B0J11DRAFT_575086 [Dendryphion nanum]|uniref:Uncharacterized protein n=1 Tax=Dendryphion nanum TaxID=256645 RepID=A0A9P9J1Y7_9PLEO|nr:hypothetical protein B0J11DRAFT_575086 [Dendryphion nanum]